MSTTSDSPGTFPTEDDAEMGDTPETPAAFSDMDSHTPLNGDSSPAPPPHKTPAQPPKPEFDPEACKATGNKYFKAGDYTKAIQEYTKGKYLD